MDGHKIRFLLATALLVVLAAVEPGRAAPTTLTLSDFSSDGNVSADLLDATLDFEVSANTLTLQVTNNTADPPEAFRINEVYFNAANNVTGLNLLEPNVGWSLGFSQNAHHVDGFGLFDVSLVNGVGSDGNQIAPGAAKTFVFSISGTGPFAAGDFTTEFSGQVDGHIQSLAAAKFVDSGQRSAYGNVVPEPAALGMLALGASALLRRRRRF